MTIGFLGWSTSFAHAFEELDAPHFLPARVVRQDRNAWLLQDESATFPAVLAGTLLSTSATEPLRPVVGDWVAFEPAGGEGPVRIRAVLPRKSAFSRREAGRAAREQVAAANIDTAFLVSGLDGDFNLRRIERYVTQTWTGGAEPVVVLNKADLCDDLPSRVTAVQASAPGVAVVALSALRGEGVEALQTYLEPGRAVVFLGSSGAGKSTLVNALLGGDRMRTGAVREADSRGRHTTTHRELIALPGGALLIDTPGLRELQLWAEDDGLSAGFPDVEALAQGCRFSDCRHDGEPGCAVAAALDDGALDPARLRNYLKLHRELEYLERQREASPWEERRRSRAASKRTMRAIQKGKYGGG